MIRKNSQSYHTKNYDDLRGTIAKALDLPEEDPITHERINPMGFLLLVHLKLQEVELRQALQ